jgi:hypothetical protein
MIATFVPRESARSRFSLDEFQGESPPAAEQPCSGCPWSRMIQQSKLSRPKAGRYVGMSAGVAAYAKASSNAGSDSDSPGPWD